MPFIKTDISELVAIVTIDRQDVLNVLNLDIINELTQVFDEISSSEVRAVILTGAGRKAFVAGADVKAMAAFSPLEARQFARAGQTLMNKISALPQPVIAAVNGYALGGGCELALACHIRVASESARFGQPEVNLGIMAGFGGTQRLPRLVGRGPGLELLITGRMVTAQEALRIGLVNKVVPDEELLSSCRQMAETISTKAPLAVRLTMEAINHGLEMSPAEGMELESQLFALTFSTADMQEGIDAFLNKRNPEFSGR